MVVFDINRMAVNNLTKSLRNVIVVVCAENSICILLPVLPLPKLVDKYWYICKKNNTYITKNSQLQAT